MSAKGIIEALEKDGWAEVKRMVKERATEHVHLEFKQIRGGGTPGPLHEEDLARVSKAISAFANVEGGVLLLGVKTKQKGKEPDRVEKITPIADVQAVEQQLDRLTKSLTDPFVPGLRFRPITDPSRPSAGVLAVYAPQSDGGPHRATRGAYEGRYYMRTSTNSEPVPHSILAGMFGRQPPPVLRLQVNYDPIQPALNVWVVNEGRGLADDAMLRISIRQTDDSTLEPRPNWGPFWDSWLGTVVGVRRFDVVGTRSQVIYPQDASRALSFDGNNPPQQLKIRARLDCRNAMPVHFEETLALDGINMVKVLALGDE